MKKCMYCQKFPDKKCHCLAYTKAKRKDGKDWLHYPECCDEKCPIENPDLLERADFVSDKKNPIRKRMYRKQLAKCRRELKRVANTYCAFDFGWLLDMMEIMFKNWAQYYTLGYNVDALERCDVADDYIHSDNEKDRELAKKLKAIPYRREIAKVLLEKVRLLKNWETDTRENFQSFGEYLGNWLPYMWD